MGRFDDFYDAYYYVTSHPANSLDRKMHNTFEVENHFWDCINIEVVKVNPNNVTESGSCIMEVSEDKKHLNTKTEIWLEYGEVCFDNDENRVVYTHDIDLDCGGNTFEEAVVKLANLLYENKYYRNMFINKELKSNE